MNPFKYCPTCGMKNKRKKLTLRQVNFKLAVYLCEDRDCPYPEGHNLVEVEERSLNELINEQKELTEESDLDRWLEKYFAAESKGQSQQIVENDIINEDDLSKIIDEIDESHIENDLNVECDNDLFAWMEDTFEQNNLGNIEHKKVDCNNVDTKVIQSKPEINKSFVTNNGQFILNYTNSSFFNNQSQEDKINESNKASSGKGPVVNTSSTGYQISNGKEDTSNNIKLKSYNPNLNQNINSGNVMRTIVVCPKEKKFVSKQFVFPTKQAGKSINLRFTNICIKQAQTK